MTPPEVSVTKAGSGGTLLPGTTAKIVDIATGKVVGPNETGEICVRGPQVRRRHALFHMYVHPLISEQFIRS